MALQLTGRPASWLRRLSIRLASCLLLVFAGTAMAQSESFDPGNYALARSGGQGPLFSVEKAGDKWLIKSSDPDFVMLKVVCTSSCDYLPMNEQRKQQLLPAALRQNFDMACIANIGFALCRLNPRPLRECSQAKAGEACRIGPPATAGKPLYALFSLFAPGVAPAPVTRVDGP